MRKTCPVFLSVFAVVFFFFCFLSEAAGKAVKTDAKTKVLKAVPDERQALSLRAEKLRTEFLELGKKQRAQAKEIGKFLREMKEAENISTSFYQDRVEKIIDTSHSFFWGKKELMRKKFSAMALGTLRLEVQKIEAEIQAMEDYLEYFAEEMALMKMIFGTEKPSPLLSGNPGALKIAGAKTPL